MIVSVASGKGGTGKTTVTASLVSVWESPVVAVDLDVEEPNLHLFLKPEFTREQPVTLEVPVVDEARCTLCGKCSEICQFKAITVMGDMLLTFPEMCHGCGGCFAVCPENALSPGTRELGAISQGYAAYAGSSEKKIAYLMGRLRVGEAMSPPLMRAVKQRLNEVLSQPFVDADRADAVIDAPPGVSCPAVAAVIDSDAILLVTEPTPFGFHDFALAWEAFSPLGKPMAAVINRAGLGDDSVERFCKEKNIAVLARIPFERDIAAGYSRGEIVATLSPKLRETFLALRDSVRRLGVKEAGHA